MPAIEPTLRFLGADRHPLHAAGDALLTLAQPNMDLSRVLVIPPTARAGRTLLAWLARRLHEGPLDAGGAWRPPRVESLAPFADRAAASLDPRREPSDIEHEAAWALALSSLSAEQLAPLLPNPARDDSPSSWRRLARLILRSAGELALHGVDVAEAGDRLDAAGAFAEGERWRAVASAHQEASRRLASADRSDPLQARLRLVRGEHAASDPPEHVVLLCLPEIPSLARAALASHARAGARLWAFVPAREDERDWFDAWGTPLTERWSTRPAHLPDDSVRVVDSALDQSHAALEFLEGLGEDCRPDAVAIVSCDADILELVIAQGQAAGVGIRDAGGRALTESPSFRLVDLACQFVARPTFDAWGSLLRHPDAERFVAIDRGATPDRAHEAWLAELDRYVQEHVQAGARADSLLPARFREAKLDLVLQSTRKLLGELWDAPARQARPAEHPPARWAALLLAMLSRAHARTRLHTHIPRQAARAAELRALGSALGSCATQRAHPSLDPPVPASEARRWIRSRVEDITIPHEPDAHALELIGWLEAPWDEAPNLVVVGAEMGHLPTRRASDPLLPEATRRTLSLPTQADRVARDRFLLEALRRGHPRVRWIAGKRSARGDPQVPSRFLLDHPGDRASRARLWIAGGTPRRPPPAVAPGRDAFATMPTPALPVIDAMRVTAFRDYIASPYLFYARHVLGAEGVRDEPIDLDAAAFGSLVHDAARRLPTLSDRELRSEKSVRELLLSTLDDLAMDRFGPRHGVPVRLQLEQARERLARFAAWQARHALAGWHIRHAEWQPDGDVLPILDEGTANMQLRGRIDRIDQHDDGSFALLDIKTAEDGADPEHAHRRNGLWIDLQLPLYRHLASQITGHARVELAYVSIGGYDRPVELRPAAWSPEDLADADNKGVEVARAVRRGEFRSAGEDPPDAIPLAWLLGRRFVDSRDDGGAA